ncbi:MAG TPA: glyoxalase, partial [Candidatus Binatia bacterium]
LAPGRNDDGKANLLQQISFRCASIADVKEFYHLFVENQVPINRCVSHGNTVSIYAEDPDGNSVEVYWPTGVDVPQPFGKPMDLSKSVAEIMQQLETILAEWRATAKP